MKITNLCLKVATTTLLTTAGLFGHSLRAQAPSVGIGVSPLVTITALRGSQARASFSVFNPGSNPIRARIYAEDFDYDRERGFQRIPSHPNSANPYLQFSPKEIVVAPGVNRDIRLNIVIPPSKPDGEYRVAVFTQDLTERRLSNPNARLTTVIRPQIGSLFFVSKGNTSPSLSAISAGWNEQTNRPNINFKNQGSKSAYPNVVWRLSKGEVQIANSIIQGVVLQSQRDRTVDIKIPEGVQLSPGEYTLAGEIDNKDGKLVPFSLKLTVPAR
jgi:hypothetical protein